MWLAISPGHFFFVQQKTCCHDNRRLVRSQTLPVTRLPSAILSAFASFTTQSSVFTDWLPIYVTAMEFPQIAPIFCKNVLASFRAESLQRCVRRT
jgi:hypothetical protein